MEKNVLISGGSGLIGTELSRRLTSKGYTVGHLSRTAGGSTAADRTFVWDIEAQHIDAEAITFADHIIHLAGAGIADKPWTDERKEVLHESRIDSARLLYDAVQKQKKTIRTFISASGISIYGLDTGAALISEDRKPGTGFVPELAVAWEKAADQFKNLGVRTVKIRTGLVLTEKGGLLDKMLIPTRFGLGAPLGSGEQFMSWIHIDDLVGIYIKALEDTTMHDAYNAAAPNPVTNAYFMKALAKARSRPFFLPNVPGIALKIVLGDMADLVLGGNNISCSKIETQGYDFHFRTLEQALGDLI
jgi:uncharacterized protein (TIGR01777 family)